MKKPHSLYLNDRLHTDVSRQVEKSLDGHGSLTGFFAYVEEQVYDGLAGPPLDFGSTLGLWLAFKQVAYEYRFGKSLVPGPSEYTRYVESWEAAFRDVPWHADNPALSHVLALSLFTRPSPHTRGFPDYVTQNSSGAAFELIDIWLERVRAEIVRERESRTSEDVVRMQELVKGDAQDDHPTTPLIELWRRDRVEFFTETESSDRPASLYLDDVHHRSFSSMFSPAFFKAAELSLWQMLNPSDGPEEVLGLTYEPHYLEHGAELTQAYFERFGDIHGVTGAAEGVGDFMKRCSLPALAPERQLIYRVYKSMGAPEEDGVWQRHPIEYHVAELFKLYALYVLPSQEREPFRVSRLVLAGLADHWLLPTRDTLEAFSGGQVRKTPLGEWEVVKGRKVILRMSNSEAYLAALILTETRKEISSQTPVYGGLGHHILIRLGDRLRDAQVGRVSFELKPELVEMALTAVREAGDLVDDPAVSEMFGRLIALHLAEVAEGTALESNARPTVLWGEQELWLDRATFRQLRPALEAAPDFVAALIERHPTWRAPLLEVEA